METESRDGPGLLRKGEKTFAKKPAKNLRPVFTDYICTYSTYIYTGRSSLWSKGVLHGITNMSCEFLAHILRRKYSLGELITCPKIGS